MNAFRCGNCGKYTKHVQITAREFCACEGEPEAVQIINGINDAIGTTKLVTLISGRKFWKCCECGLTTIRTSSGTVVG